MDSSAPGIPNQVGDEVIQGALESLRTRSIIPEDVRLGPKLAPFNPTGDEPIRMALAMLQVTTARSIPQSMHDLQLYTKMHFQLFLNS